MIPWTAAQHALARFEVTRAIAKEGVTCSQESGTDVMPAHILPSVRDGSTVDDIIGEIDQDGYVFTIDPRDQVFFPTRVNRNPKRHHRLDLVVRNGDVCVRKTFFATHQKLLSRRISERLRNGFWVEAAALLRTRGCKRVPTLRNIDRSKSAIEIEYIRGDNLRNVLSGRVDFFDDKSGTEKLRNMLREADLGLSLQIAAILAEVIKRGVAPRDVHAANFILATNSRLLYMVDFHLSWLRPIPAFSRTATELEGIVRRAWPVSCLS